VTTTGNVNVCDSNMLKALKKRAVVCNIGHFDNEIDTAFMRKNWAWEEVKPQVHKIHRTGAGDFDPQNDDYLILLAEGRLVNLGNATGHPSRIMDGSFANQVLAQIFLFGQKYADLSPAQKAERLTVEVLPKKLDEEVALEMVRGFGGVVTQADQDPGRLHRRDRRRSVQATRLPLLKSSCKRLFDVQGKGLLAISGS
jgi:adenosylhomocysteinase